MENMTSPSHTLILLRHAKAEAYAETDLERPLSARGERDARTAGRWLSGHEPNVDLVLYSPATRTRQTWELLLPEWGGSPRVRELPGLYDASAEDLLTVVRQLPDHARTVLLVGHNPGLEDLVGLLTSVTCRLKTSGIEVLNGEGRWSDVDVGWARETAAATPRG
jgi:phosphohistidine phosphatase